MALQLKLALPSCVASFYEQQTMPFKPLWLYATSVPFPHKTESPLLSPYLVLKTPDKTVVVVTSESPGLPGFLYNCIVKRPGLSGTYLN